MALGDLMASRLSQSSAALDEFGNEDRERSNVRDSDTASSSYVGGGVADNAMTTTSMAYFPQTIVLCELRHDGFEDSVPSGPSDTGLVSKWRPRDRMKTGCVALVLCLNISVDPPDVIKISPCARMECWVDQWFREVSFLISKIHRNSLKQLHLPCEISKPPIRGFS